MPKPDSDPDLYDIAIIGTGAAGYTASVYASRYKLKNIVIGEIVGGQTAQAHLVQNFPTYKEIPGGELMAKMKEHTEAYGAEIVFDRVTKINGEYCEFELSTSTDKKFRARTIILATGTKRRHLNIPGEDQFFGKGVTYCATCDAVFYKDKVAAVVGGSDAANTASLYLATLAKQVYQIYRKDKLRGEPAWSEKVVDTKNITVIYNTNVVEAAGSNKLESVKLDTPFEGSDTLAVDGLFIEIGSEPDTTLMEQLNIKMDEGNYIKVGEDQTTSVTGVWAAGDITTGSNRFQQTITAAAEGAIAAENIFTTLQKKWSLTSQAS